MCIKLHNKKNYFRLITPKSEYKIFLGVIIYLFSRGECQHFSGYCEMVKQNMKGQEWREMKKVREKSNLVKILSSMNFFPQFFSYI